MSDKPTIGCSQEDCTVATTGKCLEGLSIEECSHYLPNLNLATVEEEDGEVPSIATDVAKVADHIYVAIPYGEDLESDTAKRIMRCVPTRVVVLAGDVNSGKTTILVSIYEKFIDGMFADYMFAGSDTLPGFERRCHPSRVTSERIKPDTGRTTGMTLLHLRVKKSGSNGHSQEMLFSDISGEDFEAARNSVDFCRQMPILKRADHCLLLFDGAALASPEQRHRTFRGGEMLLRSLLDSGMFGSRTMVDVLFTKYDIIVSRPDAPEIEELIAHIEQELNKRYSSRLASLRFHRVAARPEPADVLEPAYGLDRIFASCVEETAFHQRPRSLVGAGVTTGREFDRYLDRRLPDFVQGKY